MRIPKKVPEKASGGFGAEPGQVQQGSGEGSGEGLGGFGAKVQRVPEKISEKVPEKVWESLVQGQARFNRYNRVSSAWLRSTLQKDL